MLFNLPLASLFLLPIALVSAQTDQQIVFDAIHNTTTIVGTWSSGSRQVVTGSGFANPANMSFTYPPVTGVSYSFSDTNYYEISRYRFVSNATEPNCITGVMNWAHGKYSLNANGSITMTPLGDGFQQIQDPCAAESNFIEVYNETEYYQSWRIFTDATDGFKLHLFQFDGSPVAPLFQVYASPEMLPTRKLRNDTITATDSNNQAISRRSLKKRTNAGEKRAALPAGVTMAGAAAGIMALVGLAL